MDKLKVLIAEDDVFISEQLCDILEELNYEVLEIAFDFDSALSVLNNEEVDIAILDINMHGEDQGIRIAEYIHETTQIPFIYLTSFSDKTTVEQAVKHGPSGYLVKPFNQSDIYSTLELVKQKIRSQDNIVTIKDGRKKIRLKREEILWVKVDDKYLEIYTPQGKFVERSTITNFLDRVKSEDLVRCHRSYAVNVKKVTFSSSNAIYIDDIEIPISRTYKTVIADYLD